MRWLRSLTMVRDGVSDPIYSGEVFVVAPRALL